LVRALRGASRLARLRIRLLVRGARFQKRRGERRRQASAAPMQARSKESGLRVIAVVGGIEDWLGENGLSRQAEPIALLSGRPPGAILADTPL